jgi:sensor domain CHASE-containing protein
MTIRKKTILVLALVVVALVCALWAILARQLGAGFAAVEMRDARLNMERVREGFANQQKEVCARVVDWAHWDDTWAYAADRNDDYKTANLDNLAFEGMNLDLLVISDAGGKIISAVRKIRDGSSATGPVDRDVLEANFGPKSPFLASKKDADTVVSGFALTPGKPPLLVCAMPITKSDGTGGIRGTLLFARFFDEDQHDALIRALKLKMDFADEGSPGFAKAAAVLPLLPKPDDIDVRPASEEMLVGHTRFVDVYGRRSIVARVEIPREIHAQAGASMRAVLLSLVGFGALLALIVILLVERLVLQRLAALSSKVAGITEAFNFEGRVDASGSDEISKLGTSINGLLAACEQVMYSISNEGGAGDGDGGAR